MFLPTHHLLSDKLDVFLPLSERFQIRIAFPTRVALFFL